MEFLNYFLPLNYNITLWLLIGRLNSNSSEEDSITQKEVLEFLRGVPLALIYDLKKSIVEKNYGVYQNKRYKGYAFTYSTNNSITISRVDQREDRLIPRVESICLASYDDVKNNDFLGTVEKSLPTVNYKNEPEQWVIGSYYKTVLPGFDVVFVSNNGRSFGKRG